MLEKQKLEQHAKFLVQFPEEFGIDKFGVESVTLPKQKFYNQLGLMWEPIKVTLFSTIAPSTIESVQNMVDECDERKEYLRNNKTKNVTLFELEINSVDPTGLNVGGWLVGIKDILFVDYGKLINGIPKIELTLQPSYAWFETNDIKKNIEQKIELDLKKDPCAGLNCSECIYLEECKGDVDDTYYPSDYKVDPCDGCEDSCPGCMHEITNEEINSPTIEYKITDTQFKIKELAEFDRNSMYEYPYVQANIEELEDELCYLLEVQEKANLSPVEEQLSENDSTYPECDEMSCGCPYCYIEKLEEELDLSENDNEILFDENVQLLERLQEQDKKIGEIKLSNDLLKEQITQLKSEIKKSEELKQFVSGTAITTLYKQIDAPSISEMVKKINDKSISGITLDTKDAVVWSEKQNLKREQDLKYIINAFQ